MPAPGLLSPDNFPIRQPTDKSQTMGKIVNPPRYEGAGGMLSAAVWFRDSRPEAFNQAPQTNVARVEKPTSEKSGHRSARTND